MKLKEEIVRQLSSDFNNKTKLSLKMNRHPNTIERYVRENREDGPLTKLSAINAISLILHIPFNAICEKAELVEA
jgi:hypothetical protein